jgi:hypothetical protein
MIKSQQAFGLVPHPIDEDVSIIRRQYLKTIKAALNTFATGEMEQTVSRFHQ